MRTRPLRSGPSTLMNLRRLASGSSLRNEPWFFAEDGDGFVVLVNVVGMEAEVEMTWLAME